MGVFKNTLIQCQQCRRKILVKPADSERGHILCTHTGCGAVNSLSASFYYDEAIVMGLPDCGQLTYLNNASVWFALRFGVNIIGVGSDSTIQLPRFLHNNQCYISRQHCTLTVLFDKWTGQLRYQLQDGVVLPNTGTYQPSKNGTAVNQTKLRFTELIDVPDGGLITLGGIDTFRLSHYRFPAALLDTYRVHLQFDPDQTE